MPIVNNILHVQGDSGKAAALLDCSFSENKPPAMLVE